MHFQFSHFSGNYASHIGESHRKLFYNNQDAIRVKTSENCAVVVVCDGTGSQAYSEAGAHLMAESALAFCLRHLSNPSEIKGKLQSHLLETIESISSIIAGKDAKKLIEETFQFTLSIAIFTENTLYIFSVGDCKIIVNGNTINEKTTDKKVAFLAQTLLNNAKVTMDHHEFPLAEFEWLVMGSDGLDYVETHFQLENPAEKIPLKKLTHDQYLQPSIGLDLLLNELFLTGGTVIDDTTVVVIKRTL